MTVNDRIRLYLDSKGISYPEAERMADMGRHSISRGSNITAAMLCKFISTYTDVSYEWLLTGDGAMLKDSASKESDQKRKDEAISDALRTNETDSIHIDEAPVIDKITDVKLLQFIAKLYYNYVEKNKHHPKTGGTNKTDAGLYIKAGGTAGSSRAGQQE